MRLPTLLVLALVGPALLPSAAAAARAPDPCAARKGRDLAPGAGQRAVLRSATLHFCARGGKVRRLAGAPSVQAADGRLLLVHRAATAQVLDVGTGRRATLGPEDEIVAADVVGRAGVAAVRRTASGDVVLVAAPGRSTIVVEQGVAPVAGLRAGSTLTWTRAGRAREALLPYRALRCRDLRGQDQLIGPGRIVNRGRDRFVGCASGADAPVFVVGTESEEGTDTSSVLFRAGRGTWMLRETADYNQYHFARSWDTVDLATGRVQDVTAHSGGFCCEPAGSELRLHVLLADGRLASVLESDHNAQGGRASAVVVFVPGAGRVELERTALDAPKAMDLRVEGEVVRWTVGGEERSAPLPPL